MAAAAGGDHPSVVLIVLDELPTQSLLDEAGGIDAVRFPNLAAFADDATWYRHHSALAPVTDAGRPLAAHRPAPDRPTPPLYDQPPRQPLHAPRADPRARGARVRHRRSAPTTTALPTVTGGGRHGAGASTTPARASATSSTSPSTSGSTACPSDPTAPPALDDFAEEVDASPTPSDDRRSPPAEPRRPASTGERGPAGRARRGPRPLDRLLRRRQGPGALLPAPDAPPPAVGPVARRRALRRRRLRRASTLPEEDRKPIRSRGARGSRAVSEQRHLLQAQYADRLVGQLMDGLRAEGLYDDSLVIVTADHGVVVRDAARSARYVDADDDRRHRLRPAARSRPPGQDRGTRRRLQPHVVRPACPTIADLLGLADRVGRRRRAGRLAGHRGPGRREADLRHLGGSAELTLDGHPRVARRRARSPRVGDRWIGAARGPRRTRSPGSTTLLDARRPPRAPASTTSIRRPAAAARVDRLDGLRRPPADGRSAGARDRARRRRRPSDAELVIAIDGVVVGGSKLSTDSDGSDGRIAVLLPQGVLDARERGPRRARRRRRGPRARRGRAERLALAGAGRRAVVPARRRPAGARRPSGSGPGVGTGFGVGWRLPPVGVT